MVMAEVTEFEEDVDWRGRTRTEANSHAETLSKNLIVGLPLQEHDGPGFGGLLYRRDVHSIARMGKTRGRRSKGNLIARKIERSYIF
jgi:hypothetical protein